MITSIQTIRKEQIKKKRLLEREFDWIHREFSDFHTIGDLEARDLSEHIHLYMLSDFR